MEITQSNKVNYILLPSVYVRQCLLLHLPLYPRHALSDSKRQNHSLVERIQGMQNELADSVVRRSEVEGQIRQSHTVSAQYLFHRDWEQMGCMILWESFYFTPELNCTLVSVQVLILVSVPFIVNILKDGTNRLYYHEYVCFRSCIKHSICLQKVKFEKVSNIKMRPR